MNETYPTLTMLGSKVLEPQTTLEAFPNNSQVPLTVTCRTDEFTCKCPVTGQPDFASVEITYGPDQWIVESKSLKLFLWSFREVGIFHEHLAQRLATIFMERIKPHWVTVKFTFNPRGGIGITAEATLSKGTSAPTI